MLGDLSALVLGVIVSAIGLAAAVPSLVHRKWRNATLLSFGIFSLLYGLRLLAGTNTVGILTGLSERGLRHVAAFITYVAPVPLLIFCHQILAGKWKQLTRWVLVVQVLFGTGAITSDLLKGRPATALLPNNLLITTYTLVAVAIIVYHLARGRWRPSPEWRVVLAGLLIFAVTVLHQNLQGIGLVPHYISLEPWGFVMLIGTLGYLTGYRIFTNEKRLIALESQLETARQIQSTILPAGMPSIAGLRVCARFQPMHSVAGDFYDFLSVDEKRLGVLIADVAGHGVPAALIASMVKVASASQADCASDPARLMAGLNQVFCRQLQGQFITAAFGFFDPPNRTLLYSAAGHPPLFCWRNSTREVCEVSENGLPLGLRPDEPYANKRFVLAPGDRLLFYTDGILEAANQAQEFFGKDRVKMFLIANASLPPEQFADRLLEEISSWAGWGAGSPQGDDVTLLVVDIT